MGRTVVWVGLIAASCGRFGFETSGDSGIGGSDSDSAPAGDALRGDGGQGGSNHVHIAVLGSAAGTVSSAGGAVDCPGKCTATIPSDGLALQAEPAAGATFAGWSGDCSGAGGCVVDPGTDRNVAAIFAADANLVFVTSSTMSPTLVTLGGADALCNELAFDQGLGSGYVAWLSTSSVDAVDRLAGARGWVRLDGLPFADTAADIAAGRIWYPVKYSETGATLQSPFSIVMTGTAGDGTLDRNCADYTDDAELVSFGYSDRAGGDFSDSSVSSCSVPRSVYCFGTSKSAAVSPQTTNGSIAFVTGASWSPGFGVDSADSFCQQRAASAGLSGTFQAFLATSEQSAASRFDVGGPSWVRTDGVRVAPTRADVFAAALEAPINVTASGTYVVPFGGSYTGAGTGASISPTDPGKDTCNDWFDSSSSFSGGNGESTSLSQFFDSGSANSCNQGRALYCFEQ